MIIVAFLGILLLFSQRDNLIYVNATEELIVNDEGYVFTSYDELQNKLKTDKVTRSDFSNHNFALVAFRYDGCSMNDLKVLGYEVKGNNIIIKRKYKAGCGACVPEYLNHLIPVSKDVLNVKIDYDDKVTHNEDCRPGMSYKPIIYLYPEQDTMVSVKIGYPENLTTTYPEYNNGWKVSAKPTGELMDLVTGRNLYALYWEGKNYPSHVHNTGFVVKGEDTAEFLEEKLAILGLTEREANEFIVYWLPKMEHNNYNYIYFATNKEIEEYMPLSIEPAPTTTIRVMMEFKALERPVNMTEQQLIATERANSGFVVVEWGGSEITN